MELFNPGKFTARAQDLSPGIVIDMNVDSEKAMRVDTYRVQARHDIDPLIVLAVPPCTVFHRCRIVTKSIMEPQNGKRNMRMVSHSYDFQDVCWDQISRGKFFLHEHPATASSWDLPMIRESAEHPGVTIVTGDMCRWGMDPLEEQENQG